MAILPKVIAVFAQIGLDALHVLPVCMKLGFISLNLRSAGMTGAIRSQLLFVELDLLLGLLQFLVILFNVLLVVLNICVGSGGSVCGGGIGGLSKSCGAESHAGRKYPMEPAHRAPPEWVDNPQATTQVAGKVACD